MRVLSARGSAPWWRVAAGIAWAVDHGARVVNVSVAGPGGSEERRAAVAHATANDVVVATSLPGLVTTRQESSTVEVAGPARPGATLRARAAGLGTGAAVRWFHCEALGCTRVG